MVEKIEQFQSKTVRNPSEVDKTGSSDNSVNDDRWGRKAILWLFFLTIGFSLLLWLHADFSTLFTDFFGPSTWTITR